MKTPQEWVDSFNEYPNHHEGLFNDPISQAMLKERFRQAMAEAWEAGFREDHLISTASKTMPDCLKHPSENFDVDS